MFTTRWRRYRRCSTTIKSSLLAKAARLAAGLLLLVQIGAVQAQAFSESFDDITTLTDSGWVMSNASVPVGVQPWFQGNATVFNANSGANNAYIAVNFSSTGSSGTISNWLMMPTRTLKNGDVLTFYTRKPTANPTDYPDRLEVRMSTNGASTNVGSGGTTGDYTQPLLSINPTLIANVYPQVWTQYTVTVEGLAAPTSGRLAFRYFVTSGGQNGTNSDYIGIDDVVYTPYSCPAVTVNNNLPATAVTGEAFSHTFGASGTLGTVTYSAVGTLPHGLSLSAGGVLSGTPTQVGTFNFSVTAKDASDCSGSRSFTITVNYGDADGDGILDNVDICPQDAQDNCLANGDGDFDHDEIKNSDDICPEDAANNCLANGDGDFDSDGIKNSDDACPEDDTNACPAGDLDNDGIVNGDDLCLTDAANNCLNNPNGDFDNDGIINADDACPEDETNACPAGDLDNDGINNGVDACPTDATNSCPAGDLDNDGITNGDDLCPTDASNNCLNNPDGDFDGDTVKNDDDICPADPQNNCAENPAGDTDGDTVLNSNDNCPLVSNVEQEDMDNDGEGDACDDDTDGDGVPNERDDYPLDPQRYTDPAAVEKSGDAAKQAYGQVLHNIGDINDDLVDDYVIGTPNYTAQVEVNGKTKKLAKAGKVELFSGKTGELLWAREGTAKQQLFGWAIASGSIPGDEYIDIAIGAPGANKKTGEVFSCYFDVADDQVACLEEHTFTPDASFKGSLYGSSIAIAEGVGLFIGAPKAKNLSADSMSVAEPLLNKSVGAVLFYARNDLSEVGMAMFGSALNGELGSSLAWMPTYQQLAIGAPRANKTGEVYLWGGGVAIEDTQRGAANGELFGKTLAVGSMADGVEHLAVSAPLAANGKLKKSGRVDVFAVEDGDLVVAQSYLGSSKAEQLGMSLTFAAMATGESDSLFAGSPFYSVPKSSGSKALARAGKVSRFILTNTEAQADIAGTQAKQQLGASIAAIDLTGDFKLDILAASTGANNPVNKKLKAAGKVELLQSSQW